MGLESRLKNIENIIHQKLDEAELDCRQKWVETSLSEYSQALCIAFEKRLKAALLSIPNPNNDISVAILDSLMNGLNDLKEKITSEQEER